MNNLCKLFNCILLWKLLDFCDFVKINLLLTYYPQRQELGVTPDEIQYKVTSLIPAGLIKGIKTSAAR